MGQLILYHGCMYAKKTRRLITKLSSKQDYGIKVVYVSHADDIRQTAGGNNLVTTHWSPFRGANLAFDCISTKSLESIYDKLLEYSVIGIDEFQFFPESAVEVVKKLVEQNDKTVYCAGLDSNFKRHKFGFILDLIPFADKTVRVHAKCKMCQEESTDIVDAYFTIKLNGNLDQEKEVGADATYTSVCRRHYLNWAKTSKSE